MTIEKNIHILVNGTRNFYRGSDNEAAVKTIPFVVKHIQSARYNSWLTISLEDFLGPDGTTEDNLEDEFLDLFKDAPIICPAGENLTEKYINISRRLHISNFLESSYSSHDFYHATKKGIRLKKDKLGITSLFLLLSALSDHCNEVNEVHFDGVLTGMCDISYIVIAQAALPNSAHFCINKDGCADLDNVLQAAARLHCDVI